MLFQCWASVEDASPTLKQHRVNACCLLAGHDWCGSCSSQISVRVGIISRASAFAVRAAGGLAILQLMQIGPKIGQLGSHFSELWQAVTTASPCPQYKGCAGAVPPEDARCVLIAKAADILPCKARRLQLLTCRVGNYRLLDLQSNTVQEESCAARPGCCYPRGFILYQEAAIVCLRKGITFYL